MKDQERINYLDGMRGFAILAVVIYHFFAQIDGVAISDAYEAHPLLHYNYLSVPLFFVISGCVIFLTLDKTANLAGFLIRRWIRLFPAMLIATLAIPVIAYFFPYRFGGIPAPVDLLPGLTLLGANVISALTGVQTEGLEGGFWTVYVEVRFYVMFGIFYYVLGRQRAFFTLASMSLIIVVLLKAAPLLGGVNVDRANNLFGKMLIGHHLPWFLIGMYAYLYKFREKRWLALLLAGNALAYNTTSIGSITATSLLLLLIYGAFNTAAVQAFFRNRALLFLGFVSYPLYLFNDSIGRGIVLGLYRNFGDRVPFEIFPFVSFAIIIVPVWCVAKYLEPAMQRWLKRKLLRPQVPVTPAAA